MHFIYYLTLFLFIATPVFSQQRIIEFHDKSKLVVKSKWSLNHGQLQLEPSSLEKKDTINLKLSSQDGEVWIDYQLWPKENQHQQYVINVMVQQRGEKPFIPLPNFLQGDIGMVNTGKNPRKRIVWTNVIDRHLIAEDDSLAVELSVQILERTPRKISKIPEFTLKQTWPHYTAFLIGAGLATAGYFIYQDADDIYQNKYQAQFFAEPAEPFYQDANNKRRRSLRMIYAGGAIVAVDAIWLASRWLRYRSDLNIYQLYYQKEGFTFNPTIIPELDSGISPGFSLAFSF